MSSISGLIRNADTTTPDESDKTYDVFISHASEDKDTIVRPLSNALSEAGLTVWSDEFEIKIGDSLRREIDHELAHSRFGFVSISRNFIKTGWTNYKLDGIMTKTISVDQTMLPIWHNITKDESIIYSSTLADIIVRNTAIDGVESISAEIADIF